MGYAFNGKFPPMCKAKDNMYHGYDTPAQECFFMILQYKDMI